MPKLFLLAIAAHPDDAELGCGGTLAKHAQAGQAVGVVDLTAGELGTRGTPQIRQAEADAAAKAMGLSVREAAQMRDGFFANDEEHQRRLITYIRRFRPEVIIANAPADRHPDHGRGAALIRDAAFLSGLKNIRTEYGGEAQEAWRPKRVLHMIQDRQLEPHFVVDVSAVHAQKMEAVRCYKSQFHNPDSEEPTTYISSQAFLTLIEQRDALMGKRIGTAYGEGFICDDVPGISDLNSLLLPAVS